MWTYQKARHGEQRQEVWVWTAIVLERDGRCWVDFEIGDRSAATFDKLYRRLPEAELYRTDAYGVYGLLPADRHMVGKGGAVNWLERRVSFVVSWEVEPFGAAYQGLHQKRGDVGVFAGVALWEMAAKIQQQIILIIPLRAPGWGGGGVCAKIGLPLW